MKLNALAWSLFIVFTIVTGCNKNPAVPDTPDPIPPTPVDSMPPSVTLLGKWLIQDDSVYNDGNYFIDFGGTRNYPAPGMYYGTPQDYYDFQSTGSLSIYANTNSYMVGYAILENKLIINEPGVGIDTSIIASITATAARIERNDTSSNGGVYFHRVNLKR